MIVLLKTIDGTPNFFYTVADADIRTGVPSSAFEVTSTAPLVFVRPILRITDEATLQSGTPATATYEATWEIVGVVLGTASVDVYTARERLEADILQAMRSDPSLGSLASQSIDVSTEYGASDIEHEHQINTEGVCRIRWLTRWTA